MKGWQSDTKVESRLSLLQTGILIFSLKKKTELNKSSLSSLDSFKSSATCHVALDHVEHVSHVRLQHIRIGFIAFFLIPCLLGQLILKHYVVTSKFQEN